MSAVICGDVSVFGQPLRVPADLYDVLSVRLASIPDTASDNRPLFSFLARRCDDQFLARYHRADPNVAVRSSFSWVDIMSDDHLRIVGRLARLGRLRPEDCEAASQELRARMRDEGDLRFLQSDDHLSLFSRRDLVQLGAQASEIVSSIEAFISDAELSDGDPEDALSRLNRSLSVLEDLLPSLSERAEAIEEARMRVEEAISDAKGRFEMEQWTRVNDDDVEPPSPSSDDKERSIFDDLHL